MWLPPFVGKTLAYLVAVVVSLRLGLGVYAWKAANGLERPEYRTLCSLGGGVELREYLPYLIAETELASGTLRESTGTGFRSVAAYLFGKNKPRSPPPKLAAGGGEAMSMTAPVRSSDDGSKTKISFVLPSKFSLRTAPRPLDGSSVKLRQVQPHYMAAHTFSGAPPGGQRVQRERERVLRALDDRALRPAKDESTLVYGYHDPFMTPNVLRRNEVGVYVDGRSVREAGLV